MIPPHRRQMTPAFSYFEIHPFSQDTADLSSHDPLI